MVSIDVSDHLMFFIRVITKLSKVVQSFVFKYKRSISLFTTHLSETYLICLCNQVIQSLISFLHLSPSIDILLKVLGKQIYAQLLALTDNLNVKKRDNFWLQILQLYLLDLLIIHATNKYEGRKRR